MEIRRYEFILEAETPIAHHAENQGNKAIFMRRKVRQSDGSFSNVPYLTGDTMRHALREAAAYALLDAAGILENPSLSEGALRLLFAGGMVTGRGDGAVIRLDQYRALCELIPSMRLFGGCTDNRVVPGTLSVDEAQLICEDGMRYMPAWVREWTEGDGIELHSSRAYVEEVQRVRMDPTLDTGKRRLLAGESVKQLEARLSTSEAGHFAGDALALDEGKSSMMPRTHERLVQGSLLFWRASAICYSPLDADTFMTALAVFFRNPVVGGKRGTGHGRLRALVGRELQVLRPSDQANVVDLAAPDQRVGALFRKHVAERAAQVREFFAGEVNA